VIEAGNIIQGLEAGDHLDCYFAIYIGGTAKLTWKRIHKVGLKMCGDSEIEIRNWLPD